MKYLILFFTLLPMSAGAQDTRYWHVVEDEVLPLQTPYVEFQPQDSTQLRQTILKALMKHAEKSGTTEFGEPIVILKEEDFIHVINDIINGSDTETTQGTGPIER